MIRKIEDLSSRIDVILKKIDNATGEVPNFQEKIRIILEYHPVIAQALVRDFRISSTVFIFNAKKNNLRTKGKCLLQSYLKKFKLAPGIISPNKIERCELVFSVAKNTAIGYFYRTLLNLLTENLKEFRKMVEFHRNVSFEQTSVL